MSLFGRLLSKEILTRAHQCPAPKLPKQDRVPMEIMAIETVLYRWSLSYTFELFFLILNIYILIYLMSVWRHTLVIARETRLIDSFMVECRWKSAH